MNTLALRFGIPADLETLIDTGVLAITGEDDAEKTLHLVVPSLRQKDRKGRIKIVSITWIHPDYNAQFCHYYDQVPGDLPNFYMAEENSERLTVTTSTNADPLDLYSAQWTNQECPGGLADQGAASSIPHSRRCETILS